MVLPNSLDKDIHDGIRTIECNKFGSSRGDKKEEEKASKIQKCREISITIWNSKDKTEKWRICVEPAAEEAGSEGSR